MKNKENQSQNLEKSACKVWIQHGLCALTKYAISTQERHSKDFCDGKPVLKETERRYKQSFRRFVNRSVIPHITTRRVVTDSSELYEPNNKDVL